MRILWLVPVVAACTTSSSTVATGELGPWQIAAALPTPRANHCSVAIDDWILVIGGNHSVEGMFVSTDEIHAAQLAPDGTLGPWHLAGHTPSPVTECTATSDGRTLYVVDGIYDDDTIMHRIFSATLDDGGMLPSLADVGATPGVAYSTEAGVVDKRLIVMTSNVPLGPSDNGRTAAHVAPLPSRTPWRTMDLNLGFRAQAQYAFTRSFIYTLGGYHDAQTVLRDVTMTPLDGGLTVATTQLPQAVAFGEAVAVDDWLYVVGGRPSVFGSSAQTVVFASHIASDGTLGSWTQPTALPMGRTNHDVALVGNYLVLTGGAVMGPGDANVLVSQVRFPE